MARAKRSYRLETYDGRRKLRPCNEPYWLQIHKGVAVGYRKGVSGGTWHVRVRLARVYRRQDIGIADDNGEADGHEVLTYWQAQDKARRVAEQLAQEADPEWQAAQAAERVKQAAAAFTVGEAIDHYLAWFREHRKAVEATEVTIAAHIRPTLGDRPVAELTSLELKAWRDKLARAKARVRTGMGRPQRRKADRECAADIEEAKRARRATANRILNVLRAILNKAFQDERVPDDSAWRRVKPFEKVDVPRIRFLTTDESIRLVNACGPDFRPLVRAALLTGARYGELVRMTVGAFNATTAQVFITPSKSGKARHIPLNAAGVALFTALATGRPSTALMFVRTVEKPQGDAGDAPARPPLRRRKGGVEHDGSWRKNDQQRPMLDACKRAKIEPPLRFHELRHTYASALAQAGADLLTISKLLGHSDTRVTSRHYAHLCDKTLATAVNTLLPAFGTAETTNVKAIR